MSSPSQPQNVIGSNGGSASVPSSSSIGITSSCSPGSFPSPSGSPLNSPARSPSMPNSPLRGSHSSTWAAFHANAAPPKSPEKAGRPTQLDHFFANSPPRGASSPIAKKTRASRASSPTGSIPSDVLDTYSLPDVVPGRMQPFNRVPEAPTTSPTSSPPAKAIQHRSSGGVGGSREGGVHKHHKHHHHHHHHKHHHRKHHAGAGRRVLGPEHESTLADLLPEPLTAVNNLSTRDSENQEHVIAFLLSHFHEQKSLPLNSRAVLFATVCRQLYVAGVLDPLACLRYEPIVRLRHGDVYARALHEVFAGRGNSFLGGGGGDGSEATMNTGAFPPSDRITNVSGSSSTSTDHQSAFFFPPSLTSPSASDTGGSGATATAAAAAAAAAAGLGGDPGTPGAAFSQWLAANPAAASAFSASVANPGPYLMTPQEALLRDVTLFRHSHYESSFTELEEIGSGGFGAVVAAKNKLDGVVYAVKKIRMKALDPALRLHMDHVKGKVLREVRALARLDHAFVIRYYQAWIEHIPSVVQQVAESKPTRVAPTYTAQGVKIKSPKSSHIDVLSRSPPITELSQSESTPPSTSDILAGYGMSLEDATPPVPLQGVPVASLLQDSSSSSSSEDSSSSDSSSDSDNIFSPESSESSESSSSSSASASFSESPNSRGGPIVREPRTPVAAGAMMLHNATTQPGEIISAMSDSVVWETTLYIQMQLSGAALTKELRDPNRTVDPDRNWEIFRQVATGLEHIHTRGVIHRDLKPANIFVESGDEVMVRIGDFGLAKDWTSSSTPGSSNHSASGSSSGPNYHSTHQSPSFDPSMRPSESLSSEQRSAPSASEQSSKDEGTTGAGDGDARLMSEANTPFSAPTDDRNARSAVTLVDSVALTQYKPLDPPSHSLTSAPTGALTTSGFYLARARPEHHLVPLPLDDSGGPMSGTYTEETTETLEGSSNTGHTIGVGTPVYAAPEQRTHGAYTSKADMYSLGIILFEMFVPFSTAMERSRALTALREGTVPPEFAAAHPEAADLVLALTSPSPADRPSAVELLRHPKLVKQHQATEHRLRNTIAALEARIAALESGKENTDTT